MSDKRAMRFMFLVAMVGGGGFGAWQNSAGAGVWMCILLILGISALDWWSEHR